MRPYKLLALDVDGTLVTSQGVITPTTRAALLRARERGLMITLATGRRLSTARPQIDELGITIPVILQTGAQVVRPSDGAVLYANPLPPDEVAAVVCLAIAEGVQPILYENTTASQRLFSGPAERDSIAMGPYMAARPHLVRRLPYDELARVETPLEIAVVDDLATVDRAAPRLRAAHCRTLVSYSPTLGAYFLEVVHETCSKGEALRWLAQRLGITMDEVVAVGDNYNDREMLQMAGLGVAMANAEPEIAAIADRIVPSNDDDGIAELIEWLVTSD